MCIRGLPRKLAAFLVLSTKPVGRPSGGYCSWVKFIGYQLSEGQREVEKLSGGDAAVVSSNFSTVATCVGFLQSV